jgi:hypothetical protein
VTEQPTPRFDRGAVINVWLMFKAGVCRFIGQNYGFVVLKLWDGFHHAGLFG